MRFNWYGFPEYAKLGNFYPSESPRAPRVYALIAVAIFATPPTVQYRPSNRVMKSYREFPRITDATRVWIYFHKQGEREGEREDSRNNFLSAAPLLRFFSRYVRVALRDVITKISNKSRSSRLPRRYKSLVRRLHRCETVFAPSLTGRRNAAA